VSAARSSESDPRHVLMISTVHAAAYFAGVLSVIALIVLAVWEVQRIVLGI
jgi:flagellar biogenesis protein FliO